MQQGNPLGGYSVVACQDCGFCFADEIPDQAMMDAYYQDMSKYEHQGNGWRDSDYDQARFEHVFSIIHPFLPGLHARVLEIGCANGGLLALFKQHGFADLTGIDPSPACASAARDLHGIRVLPANLSNMPLMGQQFDFIVLAGVLEHVRDLGTALANIRDLLAPSGKLYIGVPDASRYAAGEDAPFQEFNAEHINFFGPQSLVNLLNTKGFVLQHSEQRVMNVGHRTSTAVVHAIFNRATGNAPIPGMIPDEETSAGLKEYITASQCVDSQINSIIDSIVASGQPIIVWGTGAHTLRLLASSRLQEAKISVFVDSNPIYLGKNLNGVPIVAPHDLRDRTETIMISSRAYQEEIAHYICKDLNLNNPLIRLYDFTCCI
jgi:SAM-dependent methyltransferase